MKIVMTGGGSAGHVTPNIALFPKLRELGFEIHYIGSKNGMERQLIEREQIPYHAINAGKLRRYLDIKNLTDMFRIVGGFREAISILRKLKPDVVFSKGGFVSCPVVWAAKLCRIPAVIHESDMTPGLANKLSLPFAQKVCFTFPETEKHLPPGKGELTGIPVRQSFYSGSAAAGRSLCGFDTARPVILVIGGSQGSEVLNSAIRTNLKGLTAKYQICHLCGKGNTDKSLEGTKAYKQFEYVNEEIPHLFAMSDMIVSRAGATVLFEILALRKPNLLIPLSRQASRGDQILNARSFEKQGFSHVLPEEELTPESFMARIDRLYTGRASLTKAMEHCSIKNSVEETAAVIMKACKK